MKKLIPTLAITLLIGSAAIAKQLPALYEFLPGKTVEAKDYNVLVEHLLVEHLFEDERIIAGLQKQVTELHAQKADKSDITAVRHQLVDVLLLTPHK